MENEQCDHWFAIQESLSGEEADVCIMCGEWRYSDDD